MPTGFSLNKLTLSLLTLSALSAIASAPPTTNKNDVMVVTASGYEQKITEAAASINVVSQDDLQQKKFNDLAEALSDIEGLDVRGTTGKTGGLDISIRGMPSSYTLILVDGRRQNGTDDVTPNGFSTMNTRFIPPLAAIERIEVIRGPMSTLYGSDAMGGVINIITKKVSSNWSSHLSLDHTFQQDTAYGDASNLSLYSSGPLIPKMLGLALRGSGFRRDTSTLTSSTTGEKISSKGPNPVKSDSYNIGVKLTWTPFSAHSLWLDGEIARQKYDNSEGQLGSLTNGYQKTIHYDRQKIVLGHDSTLSFGTINSSLSWNQTETKGRTLPKSSLSNDADPRAANTHRLLENNDIIFESKLVAPIGDRHLLNIGGQYRHEVMKDGVVLINQGDRFTQNSGALFGEDEWRLLDNLALTYGARYEYHETTGSQVSPRAYLVWNALDDWTIKGGISTGYKTPSLSQLHNGISGVTSQGKIITLGDPNLSPEKSLNSEIGVYYNHFSGFNTNATLFHTRFRNKIDSEEVICNNKKSCVPGYTSLTSYSHPINIDKATNQGLELATTLPLLTHWTLNLNYTYTDSKQQGKNQGARLTNTPEHMLNGKLTWQATESLSTWLKMEYRGKMARFTSRYTHLSKNDQQVYDLVGKNFSPYTVWQLGAAYKISPAITLNSSVNNLLDKDFTQYTSYTDSDGDRQYAGKYFSTSKTTAGSVQPGRNYWVSLNVTF